jgi:hypothetical protein
MDVEGFGACEPRVLAARMGYAVRVSDLGGAKWVTDGVVIYATDEAAIGEAVAWLVRQALSGERDGWEAEGYFIFYHRSD